MDPIVIEKNVPIPPKNRRKSEKDKKYHFLDRMDVGDSVEIDAHHRKYKKGMRNNVFTYYGLQNAIYNAKTSTPGVKKNFSLRTVRLQDAGNNVVRVVRVWRTE